MLRGKVKFHSFFAGFALAVVLTLAASPWNALAQTAGTADKAAAKPDQPKAKVKPGFWSGFYIGAYGAGIFNRSNATTTAVGTTSDYLNPATPADIARVGAQKVSGKTSYGGGGTFGYSRQSGTLVYGGEFDFGIMSAKNTTSSTAVLTCCVASTFTITQSVRTHYLLTARPRLGYGSVDKLFYVTGGLAVTGINYDASYTDTFGPATESGGVTKRKYGWTAGGGVEIKIYGKWSVKGEYLYASFGKVSGTSTNLKAFTPARAFPANIFTHSADLVSHNIRYGINYHF
ncbi:MAG: porin family protein [Acidobacteriota bacterium]